MGWKRYFLSGNTVFMHEGISSMLTLQLHKTVLKGGWVCWGTFTAGTSQRWSTAFPSVLQKSP